MQYIKKSSIIFSIFFIFSFLIGCATHSAIKQPNLYSDMKAQQNRQTIDQVEIMVKPIVSKKENKAYYDEDLILYGVLPFHVCFKNTNPKASCRIEPEKAILVDPDGTSNPPLTLEEVYAKASKSYFRALGWGAAFGLLGAVPSAINVAVVNDKIKADYESCMIKSGELVSGAYTEGSLFFAIDNKIDSLDGWKLKFDFGDENSPKLLSFGLSGEVEQPRVPEHASKSRGSGVTAPDPDKSNVSTSDSQKIAIKVDPQAPWTGKWKVEGSRSVGGTWGLKQSGQTVKSSSDSLYEIEGNVVGNQLKGKVVGDYDISHKFTLNLSSDGQSFEGTSISGFNMSTFRLKGRRE